MPKSLEMILAIETSCDDTSVALLCKNRVLCVKGLNQDQIHGKYGGIIPELASRNHTQRLLPLIDEIMEEMKVSWNQIQGIAVTSRPGLIGSLMIGLAVAKTISLYHKIPFVGVNHIEGHLHAGFLEDETYRPVSEHWYPFLGLCVSGGHTSLYFVKKFGSAKVLSKTRDDAAGEAFDKFGKLLGLGYPAGAKMDLLSQEGDSRAFDFPRPLINDKSLDFSFSGLKTAASIQLTKLGTISEETKKNLCASYQRAIIDCLLSKLSRAQKQLDIKNVVITGGVASNSTLRAEGERWARENGLNLFLPPPRYCTDNAAMIGLVGYLSFKAGLKSKLSLRPEASLGAS